ncbi:centrosomal and chromosomal factor-like [Wyeomyia smithii]|uniref:centrosomal and chromosomal factor-like n=1 Tax=Wyeomyia smithii TaxID=174621 RepID=UPI002467F6D0|nr:centrosomal and chromosomal factor-like [Wyeomyia smithii]
MAMAACYSNYELSAGSGISHQQQAQLHHIPVSTRLTSAAPMAQKDYSIPLHVDCSVEYELPNQAKPPVGARVEPLLMIHPCYFRKMESQRRSPFINNMPNSSRSSNSIVANVVDSSSMSRRSSKSSSQQTSQQPQQHVVVSSHQSSMHHHQNLQQQIDEYVQRQMAQRSQQAHYPVGASSQQQQQQQQSQHVQSQHHRHHSHQPPPQQQQIHQQSHVSSQQQSSNQYSLQSQQQQQQQLANTSDWSRYMGPDGVVRNYGKVNIANQTAYSNSNNNNNNSKSKAIKRCNTGMTQLAHTNAAGTGQQQQQPNLMPASCAAFNSNSSLEGGLPSGPRWDVEKTSMAAVPRDFQAGPESLPIKVNASLLASGNSSQTASSNNNNYQPSATMYRNPSVVGKRDAMLSGGCGVYSNSSNNNNNNTSINNSTELGLSTNGLWDSAALLEKSPMATIPRDYQAGPDHMSCGKMVGAGSAMLTSGHALLRSSNHHTSSSSNSINSSSSYQSEKVALFGKYRQHQRTSHRLHPYMMTGSMGGSFPPLMAPAFPQMQQVSCYNV